MAIVDDWGAIRARMQEIKAERSSGPACPVCKGTGWIPDLFSYHSRGHIVCSMCGNPERHPRPLAIGQLQNGRFTRDSRR